jgi:transcriptional regulator with XRE-family HTH domain
MSRLSVFEAYVHAMSRGYSTPCAREIGYELRKRRLQAKLSAADLSRGLGWAPTKMSRIESGLYPVSDSEISHYLGWCHVPPEEMSYVQDLKKIDDRDLGFWLREHGAGPLHPVLRTLAYHEGTASRSINYESEVVPGLLQIEGYAAALFRAASVPESEVASLVRGRLDRQSVLGRPSPGEFIFFIHQQALLLPVGDSSVMHEQLLHLMFSAARRSVSIRVVPLSAGERSACRGPFQLFECSRKEHRPVTFLDTWSVGLFIDDPEYVADYRRLVGLLDQIALPEGQSLDLLAVMASEHEPARGEVHAHVEEEQL